MFLVNKACFFHDILGQKEQNFADLELFVWCLSFGEEIRSVFSIV